MANLWRQRCRSKNAYAAFLRLALGLAVCFFSSQSRAQDGDSTPLRTTQAHSTAHFIVETTGYTPGEDIRAGLKIELEPGWHTYWLNPGDSGAPVFFKWILPEGWTAGEVKMPAPLRISTPPLQTFGFENEVIFYSVLSAPKTSDNETVQVQLEAEWLVCKDICIPAVHTFSITLPRMETPDKSDDVKAFEQAASQWPEFSSAAEGSYKISGDTAQLTLLTPKDWSLIDIFPGPDNLLSNKPFTLVSSSEGQWKLSTPLSLKKQQARNRDILVEYKTPEDSQSKFTWIRLKDSAPPLTLLLVFAFIGGLILNLMPCVFPLISMKFFSVLKHSEVSKSQVQRDNAFYVLGVIVSFWALALLLFALRASGEALGWGFQLQSPAFVIFLILLFAMMAFNFLGWFEIQVLLPGTGRWLQKDGPTGHFLTGVLSTIVASPCTAPFMGVSIGFALSQPLPVMILVFTCLGIGLSFPYILLSAFPSLVRYLPRPGAWMEKLKTLMAFPLFATIIWLVWTLSFQITPTSVAWVWCSVLLLGVLVWCSRFAFQNSKFKLRLTQLVVLVLAIWTAFASIQPLASSQAVETSATGLEWNVFSPGKLEELRAQHIPVFIDFTAAWCITCQVNKQITFSDSELAGFIRDKGIHLLRADWTNRDPQITAVLQQYGRAGVPLYLFFPASGQPAVVLPEILTASIFRKHIDPHVESESKTQYE